VIGIGNDDRHDDAAGLATARLLRSAPVPGARVLERAGGAAELLAAWEGEPAVIVVDAMLSGEPPGTVRRFDAAREPLPAAPAGASTHGLGLAEAVGLARALGRLPGRLVLFGIEGADFSPGAGLTPAVAAGVEAAARLIREEIAAGA
jgi:hydrogenase maturation protease